MPSTWSLANAEEHSAQHPTTFTIPTATERSSLKTGARVQLLFLPAAPTPSGPRGERMWVRVEKDQDGSYVGSLLNRPRLIEGLNAGDEVCFTPANVLVLER